ncbi:unnamed protein product [Microthlaspi erraticum]|uniref:Serine aminopeptidase S33 domain-containing protein n=1 Tax=Microthlaspi erraticum TaxID=1685480 RepID=A0A6D2ITW9_9BRAS|nr:unnamed protein product [Microthlaspi erraticum]
MAVTLLGSSIFGLSRISSSSREGVHNADLCYSKRKYRLTEIKSVASSTTPPGGNRIQRKNKDEDGATVAKSPYWKVEAARPDLKKSLSDFLDEARDFAGDDGPPRWFSPLESAAQAPDSPLLLFLPGIDGTGLGLIRHHKKLGEIFDIWCLHIPVKDRTPAKDLVKLIERTIKSENNRFPNRPIYIVGDSIGSCLALDVAARNPNIDLVLILANPATHVNNFLSQPLSGMLNILPDGVPTLLEEIFGFKQGDPLTAMLDALTNEIAVHQIGGVGGGMLRDLFAVSCNLPTLSKIFPKDTLLWKLELLKSAIASANSHIYAVRAETMILLSGRDQWLLNEEDIDRYSRTLPKCLVRRLKDNGQFLFLEDGVDLVTIIKGTCFYRRGKSHDHLKDYIMPTPFELKQQLDDHRYLIDGTSPVMLSTLENGKVVRGLGGVPSEGPVLYVGYHMLLGFELAPFLTQFLKEKNIHVRGLAHPLIFINNTELVDPQMFDKYKIMGGVPVSNFSIYKLLQSKSHVLLYPGGVREALHRKGEAYKLFWPEQAEFVRVASKFGAKIVPFGAVGEDDICDLVLDADDQRKIPFLNDFIEEATRQAGNLREGDDSELGKQETYFPGLLPKIPGRFYYYFGKPIETAGKEQELRDKEKAQELYLQVKSEVEQCIAYLKVKRESDPYRNLLPRILYQASHGFSSEIPTFDL